MDMGLTGRTVIVTGASSSIGRGILLAFAAEGAQLVAAQRDEEAGGRAVAEANRLGGEAICVPTDVTDLASVEAMVAKTLDRFRKVDVLVNNAGGIPGEAKFIDKSREDWEKEIQLNYWGVINCTRTVLDGMIARRRGRIVSISSDAGRVGSTGEAVYAACKAGVIGFSKALAREVARHRVTVNVVCPGPTETALLAATMAGERGAKILDGMRRAIPLGRLGQPEDVAGAVAYLVSDEASYVTGQVLSVSGGLTMVG